MATLTQRLKCRKCGRAYHKSRALPGYCSRTCQREKALSLGWKPSSKAGQEFASQSCRHVLRKFQALGNVPADPLPEAPWTVERVKAELPRIGVKIGKKVVTGRLSGRLCKFTHVHVDNLSTPIVGPLWMDFEASWEAVVRCLNSNKPLLP